MLGEKILAGKPLTRDTEHAIKRELAPRRGSGARIVILMLAAVVGVLGFSQGVLALTENMGVSFTEDLVAGGQD